MPGINNLSKHVDEKHLFDTSKKNMIDCGDGTIDFIDPRYTDIVAGLQDCGGVELARYKVHPKDLIKFLDKHFKRWSNE